ncbi:uncharacterized protein LOC134669773 [Cydia fagiglandana]|uniref:uncharacterized protein LOC134669773 n=1 Tax=Cydia fagiglandana TaxID=1458189 RepID=UPI002FEE498C
MWFWLLLFLPKINYAKEQDCANIACDHNNVNVCGVRSGGSKEVSFRLFEDTCAMLKFECETGMKDFRSISMEYCNQTLSLDARRNSNLRQNITAEQESQIEDSSLRTNTTLDITDTTDISEHSTCIQCDCTAKAEPICAIRAEGARFIIKWFHDKCHMFQYNCENNMNFTETHDYICVEDKNYQISKENSSTGPVATTEETDDTEIIETDKPDLENQTCIQDECISDEKVICAIRTEAERFIIRSFNDTCHMLQHNCEKQVNFSVTDDFLCARDNDLQDGSKEDILPFNDVIEKVENTQLSEEVEHAEDLETTLDSEKRYKVEKPDEEDLLPRNLVVSTFNINDNINQTVDRFFAASHTTGIQLEKIENEDTRRMQVKYTGPINIFAPRMFRPANYTGINSLPDEEYFEYQPLVKYCFHKCPKKCPDFYRPVCGGRIDSKKQTPFLFYKNHCYMDRAKCHMFWAGYKGNNLTEIEEMGFIFCGGYKIMNMMYMFPLIRILQKMGRIRKKGKIHFVMRNLGQFPAHLQGK